MRAQRSFSSVGSWRSLSFSKPHFAPCDGGREFGRLTLARTVERKGSQLRVVRPCAAASTTVTTATKTLSHNLHITDSTFSVFHLSNSSSSTWFRNHQNFYFLNFHPCHSFFYSLLLFFYYPYYDYLSLTRLNCDTKRRIIILHRPERETCRHPLPELSLSLSRSLFPHFPLLQSLLCLPLIIYSHI